MPNPFKKPSQVFHIIDAKNQVVGRLASRIVPIIMGKHKPTYRPWQDCGDRVIITNSKWVTFTGRKWRQKLYRHHTGWPGGLRSIHADHLHEKDATRVLYNAIKGMLPKNKLRRHRLDKLHIYTGPEHPHKAQMPRKLDPLGEDAVRCDP
eukprot:gb/GECH01012939.1/.p1 GENE.gb/GECH01012939.1/~~gb/GECH01012939.1/.p1  ORF type:complete len:150 (+),score=19.37 gb/GECH01012939.1/:1-450(+)